MNPDQEKSVDDNITKLVLGLTKHFGRIPTENEVMVYLFGTNEQREEIYNNKGLIDDAP